jgi:hypothetical protein
MFEKENAPSTPVGWMSDPDDLQATAGLKLVFGMETESSRSRIKAPIQACSHKLRQHRAPGYGSDTQWNRAQQIVERDV